MQNAGRVLFTIAALGLPVGAAAQVQGTDFNAIQIVTEKVGPNLYLLSGSAGTDPNHQDAAGGRIGVLAGADGVLMVDSQYAQLTAKVAAAVRRISSEPIRGLINTHIHIDHTGGNANFAHMGAVVYAREELRDEMIHAPASRDPAGYPVVTYGMGQPVTLH